MFDGKCKRGKANKRWNEIQKASTSKSIQAIICVTLSYTIKKWVFSRCIVVSFVVVFVLINTLADYCSLMAFKLRRGFESIKILTWHICFLHVFAGSKKGCKCSKIDEHMKYIKSANRIPSVDGMQTGIEINGRSMCVKELLKFGVDDNIYAHE